MMEAVRTARLLRELRGGVRRAPEEIRARQGALLRRAVAHASSQVPFYQRLWTSAGVSTDQIRSVDDLRRLPIVTADRVRAAAERGELTAGTFTPRGGRRFWTSGSSGKPLEVPRGPLEARLWRVAGLRMQLEHGFRWWDTTVQFDAAPGPAHPLQALGLAPAVWIPLELPLDEQLDGLERARARVILGNVTVLRRISHALAERCGRLTRPASVFPMGEVLDDDSRTTIRAAFGIEPTDLYGMTEVGFIAWQCERRSPLHVNAELVIVEILRDEVPARPGELGRVVVTDLRGQTMPFLRYDTGDLARAAGPCNCGRTLPAMGPVEGRTRHAIHTIDGRTLTQRAVMNHLAATLRMGEYRLRRESDHRFRLEVTPRGFAAGFGEAEVRRALRELIGDVELVVESTDAFPEGSKTHAVIDARMRS